ncbi:MAG: prepilin-type N-terminal cleavage/methylation domain-containing protein [Candidatus Geothermincolales bacterium]
MIPSADREEGFTLTELMVTFLIISILVAIAMASYSFSVRRSQTTGCQANLRNLRQAVDRFFMDREQYPSSLDDLVPEYVVGPRSLKCPAGQKPYLYDPDTGVISCENHPEN